MEQTSHEVHIRNDQARCRCARAGSRDHQAVRSCRLQSPRLQASPAHRRAGQAPVSEPSEPELRRQADRFHHLWSGGSDDHRRWRERHRSGQGLHRRHQPVRPQGQARWSAIRPARRRSRLHRTAELDPRLRLVGERGARTATGQRGVRPGRLNESANGRGVERPPFWNIKQYRIILLLDRN